MAAVNFPNEPTDGQIFEITGRAWQWSESDEVWKALFGTLATLIDHGSTHESGGTDTINIAQSQVTGLTTSLGEKAPIASPTFTGTVSGVTKAHVGLENVDNTSDASKPVSTATQTALNLKANIASPTFSGTVSGITKAMVGLGNVDNTSDANKPLSTVAQNESDYLRAQIDNIGGELGALSAKVPYGTSAGTIGMTGNGATIRTAAVTFPSGRFNRAPRVTATCRSSNALMATSSSISSTGFTMTLRHVLDSVFSSAHSADWIAIQMTSGNASG
jgi:hypothetical protein